MTAQAEFIAFLTDASNHATAVAFGEAQGWRRVEVKEGTIEDAIAYLGSQPTPKRLLVEIVDEATATEQINRLADVCEPGVQVIVTGSINTYTFFLQMQEMGIAHYLLQPLQEKALLEAFTQRPDAAATAMAERSTFSPRLISLIGSRGGVGVSTLAAALAWMAATRHAWPTMLLDPDLHFGVGALLLDIEPGKNLFEALSKPDRIDSLFMERVMVKASDTLHCVSGEDAYDKILAYPDIAASILLDAVQPAHPAVFVDLPRQLTPFSRKILSLSTHILVVSDLSIAGLRDTIRLQDFCRDEGYAAKVKLIVNRVGQAVGGEMAQKSFEKNIRQPLAGVIPYDAKVIGLGNSGHIASEHLRQTKIHAPLTALVDDLLGETGGSAAEGSGLKPLLGKLFGH